MSFEKLAKFKELDDTIDELETILHKLKDGRREMRRLECVNRPGFCSRVWSTVLHDGKGICPECGGSHLEEKREALE